MAGCAAMLTILAVWMMIRNRQRAIWLQVLSATGLSSSGLAACLAVSRRVPIWGWWVWALFAGHFLSGILVVHTRLEARIAVRKTGAAFTTTFFRLRRDAVIVQAVVAIAALAMFLGRPIYGAAMALSAAVHLRDLYTQHTASALSLPMSTVGKRALAVSILFTLLLVAGSL